MAGNGPPPKPPGNRRRTNQPARGEYQRVQDVGWQHGPIPRAPDGLLLSSQRVWRTWMRSWVAAHWGPWDLPTLRILIKLYDAFERGTFTDRAELRLWMDGMGLTPKGQQNLRWVPPLRTVTAPEAPDAWDARTAYAHLRVDVPGNGDEGA